jgi:hypothetical protein
LERLRKKQAEREESKLSKIKGFFRRNAKRFLVVGLFTVIFSALALAPGIGFTATVNITSSRILVQGHPCYGYICYGTIKVTFNPILYPVNHLLGSEISTEVVGLSEPYDSSGESAKEKIILRTLLNEFPINIPFFYAAGFVLTVALGKVKKRVWKICFHYG